MGGFSNPRGFYNCSFGKNCIVEGLGHGEKWGQNVTFSKCSGAILVTYSNVADWEFKKCHDLKVVFYQCWGVKDIKTKDMNYIEKD